MATPCARPSIHRLALRGTIVLLVALVSASGLSRSVCASQFLDDFESDGEVSQIPAPSLHNWNIISSVDLLTESNAPLCRLSGICIDLVGTAGTRNGGVVTKQNFPLGDYVIGFFLYGSGRDQTGLMVASGGTVSRIQVIFGAKSIYANKNIGSDFDKFVILTCVVRASSSSWARARSPASARSWTTRSSYRQGTELVGRPAATCRVPSVRSARMGLGRCGACSQIHSPLQREQIPGSVPFGALLAGSDRSRY